MYFRKLQHCSSLFKCPFHLNLLIFLQNHNSTALVCQCNPFGSTNQSCDQIDGKCICKIGYEGMKCDKCASGLDIEEPNHESQCSGKNYEILVHENQKDPDLSKSSTAK